MYVCIWCISCFSPQTSTSQDYMWKTVEKDGYISQESHPNEMNHSLQDAFSNLGNLIWWKWGATLEKSMGKKLRLFPKDIYILKVFTTIFFILETNFPEVDLFSDITIHPFSTRTWLAHVPSYSLRVIVIAHDAVFVNHQLCFRRTALWKTSQEN